MPKAKGATCSVSSSAATPSSRRSRRCSNLSKPAGPASASKDVTSGSLKAKPLSSHLSRHSAKHCRTPGVRSPSMALRWGSTSSMCSSIVASSESRAPRLSSVARRTFHCWCLRLASSDSTSGPPAWLTRSAPKCRLTFFVISQHSFFASGQGSVSALEMALMMSPAKGLRRSLHRSRRWLSNLRTSRRSSSLCSGKGTVLRRPSSAASSRGSRFSRSASGIKSANWSVIATDSSRHFSVWSANSRNNGLWSSSRKSRCANSGGVLPLCNRVFSSLIMAPRRSARSPSLRQLMSRRTVSKNSWYLSIVQTQPSARAHNEAPSSARATLHEL
mmetsp:Transcript_57801/g.163087  ORF Transcript_57801/g.163087 Transcript_57801/m.163087 type:complete len:331 (+) Transcript_57801:2038-3030(+)